MSKIVTAKVRADGTVVEVLKDGVERPFPDRPIRPMTDDEILAAALADPDAQPRTREQLVRMRRRQAPKQARSPHGAKRNAG
jgi:putative transcriptional regulator